MKRPPQHCLVLAGLTVGILWGTVARGQGLTPRPGGGMGQPSQQTEEKKGPAEAAPEGKEDLPELPALPPWPGQETRKLQMFQLNGYFRFRTDMFHNLNLGMVDSGRFKAPFYNPISEHSSSTLSCADRVTRPVPGGGDRDLEDDDCPAATLGSANIRLRLEPTINVGEQVRVHTQVDIFDNLVLGSTSEDLYGTSRNSAVPLAAFADSQAPPLQDRNSGRPAIVVKRAWGEVDTPLGTLRFGRMPVHWGMGLVANDGSCWDCDFGDSADRILFERDLGGYDLAMGYDFRSNGPTTQSVASGLSSYGGQAVDLEQLDDVNQWFWVIGRIDEDEVIRDRVDRGQMVINYGLYLVYTLQDFDYAGIPGPGFGSSSGDLAAAFIERHMWSLMPDLWFKLLWKRLHIEFEAALLGGTIVNASHDINVVEDPVDIFQFGWVLRSSYRWLRDSLRAGLEIGMASGDQAEPHNSDVNRRRFHPLGRNADDGSRIDNDGSLRELRFDWDYHVDLILFREVLGTVANALYFKPWVQYMIVDTFGARLDAIYSLTHQPTAFPGNARNLGLEFDLDIFYQNLEEKFFAGVQYGVMIPFGALDLPAEVARTYNFDGSLDAEVAHTLQARLIIRF